MFHSCVQRILLSEIKKYMTVQVEKKTKILPKITLSNNKTPFSKKKNTDSLHELDFSSTPACM